MEKKLFRNDHNKVVGGVCAGLADYMAVDITIVRLIFVLSALFLAGTGLLVYIVMWIVVPVNNDPTLRYAKFNAYFDKDNGSDIFNKPNAFTNAGTAPEPNKWNTPNTGATKFDEFGKFKKDNSTSRTIFGLILLVFGLYFFLDEFNIFPRWFELAKLWPLVLVAVGVSVILKAKKDPKWEAFKKENKATTNTTEETLTSETPETQENKN